MKNTFTGRLGFTLIELLVVVLIIGILAAIALPQYQKAVAKSRFAEGLINLKTIAQANEACAMGKGEFCLVDELSVSVGEQQGVNTAYTEHFFFVPGDSDATGNAIWAVAEYRDEDVCLCYLKTGEIVLSQDHDEAGCASKAAKYDYAKLLKLRDVGYDGCGCC